MKINFKQAKMALLGLLVLLLGSVWINFSQEAQIRDLEEKLQILEFESMKSSGINAGAAAQQQGPPQIDLRDNYQRVEDSLVAAGAARKQAMLEENMRRQAGPSTGQGVYPYDPATGQQMPQSPQQAPSIEYTVPSSGGITPGVVGGTYTPPPTGNNNNTFKDMNKGF